MQSFNVNHPLLYVLAGLAVAAVLAQSVAFLRKAWKRAIELGYSTEKLKKLATSAALFTIAPAIAIGLGIITLSGTLGLPLPWLRLSVVGALPYELTAATTAAKSMATELGATLTAQQFTTIAWTMTVGISTGLVLIPLFCRKYTGAFAKVGQKDATWGTHFTNAIFIGLVATFVGQGLSGITESSSGIVSAIVLAVSAGTMCLCGLARNKLHWNWLNDYALPICMIVSMASAVFVTQWIG